MPKRPNNKKKTLRLGFIGTGGIAQLQLAQFNSRPDVDLIALADISQDNLAKSQASYPDANTYTDYQTMLAKENLDAVSVCTPNLFHAPPTIAALKATRIMISPPQTKSAPIDATVAIKALMNGAVTNICAGGSRFFRV